MSATTTQPTAQSVFQNWQHLATTHTRDCRHRDSLRTLTCACCGQPIPVGTRINTAAGSAIHHYPEACQMNLNQELCHPAPTVENRVLASGVTNTLEARQWREVQIAGLLPVSA